jgi:hypothetical protein
MREVYMGGKEAAAAESEEEEVNIVKEAAR